MNRQIAIMAAALAWATSGCNQFPPFRTAPRDAWTFAQTPHGAGSAAQPFLVVPSADNPAELGVFAEIDRLRNSNSQLQESVTAAAAENQRTRETLEARTAELNAARTDLANLQLRIEQLSRDMVDWKQDVGEMHSALHNRQQDELQMLDELIVTVEMIRDSMQLVPASPNGDTETTPTSLPTSNGQRLE